MKKTSGVVALMFGLVLGGGAAARAQSPQAPASKVFASVNIGAGLQSHTFSNNSTFTLFSETATIASNQSVGRGFLFDIGGGYRLANNLAVGVGLWTQRGSGSAAIAAALPDPVLFGRPKLVALTTSDLNQTAVGVNLQIMWTTPIAEKMDLTVFGGPTIIHASQDVGTIVVVPNTQNSSAATVSESKTSGKAGNIGVDVSYKLTDRYAAGAFLRYAGGSLDLPSVQGLKVGGVQLGVGVRVQF